MYLCILWYLNLDDTDIYDSNININIALFILILQTFITVIIYKSKDIKKILAVSSDNLV